MDNFAITAADAVSRRYKSNDPEAIIAQRAIKIKDIRFCEELLGFYTVLLNCEYIGINPNCSKQQRRSALAHELGHAIFDRKHAASGQAFQDTYFYSLSNAKAERRANTFAAELLLSDDDVLKPIGFYEFNADRLQMEASLPPHCSSTYRALKYHELLQDFQYTHHPHTKCDRSEVAGLSSMGLIKADRDESVDITYQPMHMLDTYCVTDFYRIYEEYLRQSRKSELFKSLWLPIIVSLVTTLTVNALQWLWPLLSRWFSNSLV